MTGQPVADELVRLERRCTAERILSNDTIVSCGGTRLPGQALCWLCWTGREMASNVAWQSTTESYDFDHFNAAFVAADVQVDTDGALTEWPARGIPVLDGHEPHAFDSLRQWYSAACPEWDEVGDIEDELGRPSLVGAREGAEVRTVRIVDVERPPALLDELDWVPTDG